MEVRRRFAEQNLSAPNYRTVCRRVETLDLRLVTAKREGSKKARELLCDAGEIRSRKLTLPQWAHLLSDMIVTHVHVVGREAGAIEGGR